MWGRGMHSLLIWVVGVKTGCRPMRVLRSFMVYKLSYHVVDFYWVAVKELKLSYHNGYM